MPSADETALGALAARSRLSRLAKELEERHGPGRALPGAPERVIDRAARKLAANRGDLGALDFAEKKAVLDLLWRRRGPWIALRADVEAWLQWAEKDWKPRISETRVCIALLRHYDPELPVAALSQAWLADRADALWGRFGDFIRRWRLWEGGDAVSRIGAALAAGDLAFLLDAERAAQTRPIVQGSSFLVAVAENFAQAATEKGDWAATGPLLEFFEPAGLLGAAGPASARARAKIALVSGLILWAQRDPRAIPEALRFAFRIAGDPRAGLDDWRDIPDDVLAQVERWLAEDTLESSFQIVAELRTDDSASLARRRAFWRAFLPHVTRARLIGARKALAVAKEMAKTPSCALNTYLSDHCGFLLELRGPDARKLIVFELNNLAQSLFWRGDDPRAPEFGPRAYDGAALRAKCDLAQSHLPPEGWEEKFAALIARETRIVLPAFSPGDI
ncbi:MAG TPA: EH signature domain-containing protein [Rhodoblastus sp.]|nr:EH signature domain-containing protein [Rhodoblastus sp.]